MFCPNCGQSLADGARFCANCGSSLTPAQPAPAADYYMMNSMHQYQAQKSATRQSEMNTLDNLISYFGRKEDQYDEYDAVSAAVNVYSRGAKKGLIVWGAILASFGFIFQLARNDADAAVLGTVGLIIFLLPGLAMIFGGIMMQISNKKKYQRVLARWQELSDELYRHYAAYPSCPIGPEYSNPHILRMLRNTLQSGRADTIKECLNLMVADANQRALEDYMAQIQRNTAQTARASTATAVFMAASFFS